MKKKKYKVFNLEKFVTLGYKFSEKQSTNEEVVPVKQIKKL